MNDTDNRVDGVKVILKLHCVIMITSELILSVVNEYQCNEEYKKISSINVK